MAGFEQPRFVGGGEGWEPEPPADHSWITFDRIGPTPRRVLWRGVWLRLRGWFRA